MSDAKIISAARDVVQLAQTTLGHDASLCDLLTVVTLAYGYTRDVLEDAGIPTDALNIAEESGLALAKRLADIRRAKLEEGMPQA